MSSPLQSHHLWREASYLLWSHPQAGLHLLRHTSSEWPPALIKSHTRKPISGFHAKYLLLLIQSITTQIYNPPYPSYFLQLTLGFQKSNPQAEVYGDLLLRIFKRTSKSWSLKVILKRHPCLKHKLTWESAHDWFPVDQEVLLWRILVLICSVIIQSSGTQVRTHNTMGLHTTYLVDAHTLSQPHWAGTTPKQGSFLLFHAQET